MRIGGKTFDERDVFDIDDTEQVSTDYNESKFFNSFYKVDSRNDFDDRSTIGHMVTKPATRFHYNAVENGIIRSIAHREPPPYGSSVRTWEFAQVRRNLRLLDIGSGTGHWIDFFMDALYVTEALGLEVAANMHQFLQDKYANNPNVDILNLDIGRESTDESRISGKFDYISAIGVMFHITDDGKWLNALRNMRSALAPGGLVIVGGDFGWQSRNVQFHRTDEFDDWNAQTTAAGKGHVFVNKRVRSLAEWHQMTSQAGLAIVDLVRVDNDWAIHTPENDLLVLGRIDSA